MLKKVNNTFLRPTLDPKPKFNGFFPDTYHILPPRFVVIPPVVLCNAANEQTNKQWNHNLVGGGTNTNHFDDNIYT